MYYSPRGHECQALFMICSCFGLDYLTDYLTLHNEAGEDEMSCRSLAVHCLACNDNYKHLFLYSWINQICNKSIRRFLENSWTSWLWKIFWSLKWSKMIFTRPVLDKCFFHSSFTSTKGHYNLDLAFDQFFYDRQHMSAAQKGPVNVLRLRLLQTLCEWNK